MERKKKGKRVRVSLSDLIDAFEDGSWEIMYYLNLKTGEVFYVTDSVEDEELREEIEDDSQNKYVPIPFIESSEGYKDMVDFTDTVKDEILREKLLIALDGPGAFRRFKDVLLDYPEERERWFKFRDEQVKKRVLEWIEDEGFDFEIY